jgi:YVTN family beta-propeller protein
MYRRYRSEHWRRRRLRRSRLRLGVLVAGVVAVAVAGTAAVLVRGGHSGSSAVRQTGATTGLRVSPSPSASPRASATASPHPSATPSVSVSPFVWTGPASSTLRLKQRTVITGTISPKSVVATQNGYVFAQNMMYRHTITVYNDRTYRLVKTIQDTCNLSQYGYARYAQTVRGAPVEAAVSADGKSMYVSNYSMYGPGFTREGHDVGSPSSGFDRSFLYRVNLSNLRIDQATQVGVVPKYVATTPDGKFVLVSNWCSYNLSVVSVKSGKQVRQIPLGPYPRGIVVDSASRFAYVAVMGTTNIARIDLRTFAVRWLRGVGSSPRHLCISPDDRWLYVSLNGEGTVAKIDLRALRVVRKVSTGSQPRSMTIAPDGASLYVVNYNTGTVSKVRASDMRVLQTIRTNWNPIGITYVAARKDVWVACYGGSIMVFHDT